ncbi:MAG: Nonribosomal peptide synthetase DhbF [Verrucomicrobiota bacterium]
MPADLAGRLLLCGRELWNVYGPTETTIWSAIKRVESAGAITIGHPIDNTQLFVTDEGCRILPVGVVGELLIGGYGLAQGYRGRKELTAERFVEMDWGGERRRVYRTGDLAKWLPNGELQCLGRVDHQVKVRGYRIELGEIETALVEDAGVKEAVVVVQDMGVGDRRLVAYVVRGAGNGNLSDESHVKEVLRQRLPEYMVPSHFRVLEALPRTPNGKTDRKALPPVEVLPCRDEHKKRETEGHVERRLASIWAEVLRLPSVGVEDDFFDLGGHSVLAVKLFNRIEEEFGVRLPLATLFRAPTVEQLARELPETNDEERAWSCLVTIQQGSEGTPLFFVHGAGGNVLLYRELARQLGRDRMIYGLQSQGLDGVSQPLESVEDMAQLYLKEIRKVQPRGPYLLGGYCMGGTVAYEIAQCLRRTGEVVERLFLMDTYNFTEATQTGRVSYLLQRMGFHLRNLAGLPMGQLKLYLKEKLRIALDGEWRNLLGGIDAYRAAGGQLQMKNELAAEAYSPQLYRGPVTVFKPRVNYACYSDPSLGWSKLIPEELQVIELPVNPHAMLVPPCVATLAEEIRAQLSASAGSSSNGPVLSRADSLALVH